MSSEKLGAFRTRCQRGCKYLRVFENKPVLQQYRKQSVLLCCMMSGCKQRHTFVHHSPPNFDPLRSKSRLVAEKVLRHSQWFVGNLEPVVRDLDFIFIAGIERVNGNSVQDCSVSRCNAGLEMSVILICNT